MGGGGRGWGGVRGADEEDDEEGEEGDGGEGAENEGEGDAAVAEDAEAPVAEAAAGDADEVHEAIASGADFGAGDLAEDGHVIAVEEAPADAEEDQEGDGEGDGAGVAEAEEGGEEEGHAEGAGVDASAWGAAHPAVGEDAAEDGTGDGGELDIEDGDFSGFSLGEVELVFEDDGHPVFDDPAGDGGEGEVEDEEDEVAVVKEFADGGEGGVGVGGGVFGELAGRIFEEEEEGEGVGDADEACDVEGPAPGEGGFVGDEAGVAAEDETDVDAGLVYADGAGAGLADVEVGDEGEGGRDVEGFTDAHEGAGGDEAVVGGDVAGHPGDDGPGEEADGDDVAAGEAVGDVTADGAEEGIDPFEGGEDEAPLGVGGEAGDVGDHGGLHGGEHLAVEVVQEGDGPEEADDEPGGAGEGGGHFWIADCGFGNAD